MRVQSALNTLSRPGPTPPDNHPTENIITLQVKSDYTPVLGDFENGIDSRKMLHVRKGDWGFGIRNTIEYKPKGQPTKFVAMLFSFGKDRAEGYVLITYLIRGSELRPVTVAAEFAPNFTSSCLDQPGGNLGSVL
jgi:hypothetical protein